MNGREEAVKASRPPETSARAERSTSRRGRGTAEARRAVLPPARAALVLGCILGLAGLARGEEGLETPRPPGVTLAVESAIEKGIRYFARTQADNGSWGAFGESQSVRSRRVLVYPVAVTGLAGLAFLAHGDTPSRGPHASVVLKITDYLLSTLKPNGLFTDGNEPRPMYGHAFAMTFLAQALGQEPDPERRDRIRRALRKAIDLTRRAQTDHGGWGYTPNYHEDEGTLTVTQLQGLRACRDAGILVTKDVMDGGVRFIKDSTNPNGAVRYRVTSSRIRPGVTCAAVVTLWSAGEYDSPLLRQIMSYVNRNIHHDFQHGEHAEYVEYYLAQAKWLMGDTLWDEYYRTASSNLARIQQPDGSWRGSDSGQYGSNFATAVVLIVLQLPYDRLPVYER